MKSSMSVPLSAIASFDTASPVDWSPMTTHLPPSTASLAFWTTIGTCTGGERCVKRRGGREAGKGRGARTWERGRDLCTHAHGPEEALVGGPEAPPRRCASLRIRCLALDELGAEFIPHCGCPGNEGGDGGQIMHAWGFCVQGSWRRRGLGGRGTGSAENASWKDDEKQGKGENKGREEEGEHG